ncbi:MAG: L-erythro-3,5-diaminohexanoate dehydrogenase, partial [Actinomycetota bacterium]|nr:L-erythro-3,5-diaminohexanoate dehydrogenase [Actinomycetota bacterium]
MSASLRERTGAHRVLDPPGGLPQPARRVDPHAPLTASELALDVDRVSVDAWSFRQLWAEAREDDRSFARALHDVVEERGKLHNPQTDSGGTLIGTVAEIGDEAAAERRLASGDRVVPLASCSAIPLVLEHVRAVNARAAEVEVEARAIVPLAFPVERVPTDLDERLVVAAADTAGAPGLVHDLVAPGAQVTILGANGTAGLLACASARDRGAGRVVGVDLATAAL